MGRSVRGRESGLVTLTFRNLELRDRVLMIWVLEIVLLWSIVLLLIAWYRGNGVTRAVPNGYAIAAGFLSYGTIAAAVYWGAQRDGWRFGRTARLIAAFLAGSAVIGAGGSVFLLQDETWYAPALVTVTSLALLLRARHFRGRTQRLWLICGGVLCAMLLAAGMAVTDRGDPGLLLMLGVPCVLVACLIAAWGIWMPGRILSPYWGRYADLFEVVVLLTVVPLTIGVIGLYGTIWDRMSGG